MSTFEVVTVNMLYKLLTYLHTDVTMRTDNVLSCRDATDQSGRYKPSSGLCRCTYTLNTLIISKLGHDSSAGNVTGTGTSALRWPSYALAILRCWQAIFTGSGAGTPPPVHTATALTRRQSTWSSIVQLMSRPEGTSGREDSSTRTHDASGTSWNGLGW